MKGVKSLLVFIGLILLIVIIFGVLMFGIPIPFPVDLLKVDKIELVEKANHITGEEKIFIIDNKYEIKYFLSYFNGISWGVKETPSCPFGLPIKFYEGSKVIKMDLGTDSCGLVKYKDYYFYLNRGMVEELQDEIRKLGIDFDRIRL